MLDFTSALYLGIRHPSRSLRPWTQLTTGKPAALAEPTLVRMVAQDLAKLTGCEHAMLAPSTLHLFWDLLGLLSRERIAVYLETGSYPIACWGVERAAGRGVPVRLFPPHHADALQKMIKRDASKGLRPIVVSDSFSPVMGRGVPIALYLDLIDRYEGYFLMDDTQAFGILGRHASAVMPYGYGGGGMLCWAGVKSERVVIVSSLAKGFGIPVAVLAGSETMVRRFEKQSETRTHCSPPSTAVVHAAEHALAVNAEHGDKLRMRLLQRVKHFRSVLTLRGITPSGAIFPVQTLTLPFARDAKNLHARLLRLGVRVVPHRNRFGGGAHISFLLTTLHTYRDIDLAVEALTYAAHPMEVNYEAKI